MDDNLDARAKALWDACQTSKPSWDQLGDVTKGEWRKKVHAGLTPADYRGPFPARQPAEHVPTYTVTELPACAGLAKVVKIEATDTEPAFVDESEPLVLAASSASLPALDSYLSALAVGDAWVRRECRGSSDLATLPVGNTSATVSLCSMSNSKRATTAWYALLVGEGKSLIELTVRDEHLGRSLLAALTDGSLTAQEVAVAATPSPESPNRPRPGV